MRGSGLRAAKSTYTDAVVHFLFEAAGYVAGVALYTILRRRRGDVVSDRDRATVFAGAAVGAALGSRILFVLSYLGGDFFGGKSIVGGLLGGLIGVELAKKLAGITRSTGDLFVYPLITAISIGRIGCFLAGPADKTAGLPTSLPWGMAIGDGVRRHPVALYEIAFLLLLALALARVRGGDGTRFRLFMTAYLSFRFAVDFLKPDPPPILLGLSAIQWACAAGVLYYCFLGFNASLSLLRRRRVDLHDVLPQG